MSVWFNITTIRTIIIINALCDNGSGMDVRTRGEHACGLWMYRGRESSVAERGTLSRKPLFEFRS